MTEPGSTCSQGTVSLFLAASPAPTQGPAGPCTSKMGRGAHLSPSGVFGLYLNTEPDDETALLSPTQTSSSYRHRVATDGARDRDEQSPELCLRYRCQVYRTN